MPAREYEPSEAPLNIDPDVFRQMSGKYVFSRVLISNADELRLDLVGSYSDEGSPYVIHVYRAAD